jgi:uncharacterized protein (TIGR04168 family)
VQIALIGDVHELWTEADNAWFNQSNYDAILLTGDLPGRTHRTLLTVARRIAGLTRPTVMIPGNHDGPELLGILREALLKRPQSAVSAARMAARIQALDTALGTVVLGGYSMHRLGQGSDAVDVICCRPHAMDGRHLTFSTYLAKRYAVGDMASSTARLQALVEASSNPIVFLAHNGPRGFGSHPTALWGLSPFGRDNGDVDLQQAIVYAHQRGKPIAAVVAGHLHWHARRPRTWQARRDGVLHINAARVPRIEHGTRHHLALHIQDGHAHCVARDIREL